MIRRSSSIETSSDKSRDLRATSSTHAFHFRLAYSLRIFQLFLFIFSLIQSCQSQSEIRTTTALIMQLLRKIVLMLQLRLHWNMSDWMHELFDSRIASHIQSWKTSTRLYARCILTKTMLSLLSKRWECERK